MSGSSSGASLESALQMVATACILGSSDALNKTRTMVRSTMLNPGVPPPIQALGTGLVRVLDGKRGADATADLPPDVAKLVQAVLEMIQKGQEKKL